MIQKHSTSKFATKLKFKIYKPNKNSQFLCVCVSPNTDINKLNWRFNHIFLVIANRDFYCMTLIVRIVYFDLSQSHKHSQNILRLFKICLTFLKGFTLAPCPQFQCCFVCLLVWIDASPIFCSGLKGRRTFWLLNHPSRGVPSLFLLVNSLSGDEEVES